MESKLRKQRWGWEYVSKNGNTYSIGPVTMEFNVIVDDFDDINELFDYEALVHSHLVDYVYGDLEEDADIIKEWLDERIERYEDHERTVKFYTNLWSRNDSNVLYECYLGLDIHKEQETVNMSKTLMYRTAEEIKGGK
jgi:hypothetical protein